MPTPVYSIIIPHYNIPDLLMRCLASIPVREDIQVIVVDDCSPGADAYPDRYPALSRPFLELYHTPVGGSAGRARNVGLDHAEGKWVIFMDADDLFVSDMEDILKEAEDRPEDILFYRYRSVLSEDITKAGTRVYYYRLFEDYKKNGDERRFRYDYDPVVGKIIRNDLIKKHNIRCSESRFANDALFSLKCGTFADTIAIMDRTFILVTERDGSLTTSIDSKQRHPVEEYQNRLTIAMEAHRFMLAHRVTYLNEGYKWFSELFFQTWPAEFILFYFKTILRRYPDFAHPVASHIVHWSFRRIRGTFKRT